MPAAPTLLDEPQHAPDAEAALRLARIIRAIDCRYPVIEEVDQCRRDERSASVAKLGNRGPHRSVLDHRAVIAVAHQCHVAVAMARALIGREQPELLGRSAGEQFRLFTSYQSSRH